MSKIKKVHIYIVIMTNKISILYTTVSSLNAAEPLAAKSIEDKLVTCVNIIPGCMSIYAKDGKIMKGTECYLIFKTTPDKIHQLKEWLKANHPYDLPEILEWDATSSPEFIDYIESASKDFGPN